MNTLLRRRLLLQLMGIASAQAATGCGSDSGTSGTTTGGDDAGPGAGKNVVVLGGGLAGLCSAYELQKKGYTILAVLEAQARVGGRVHTIRDGLVGGQYVEAGATRIPDTHNFTLAYAKEFKLTLRQYMDGDGMYYLKGKPPFIHHDGDVWPPDVLAFDAAEASLGADSIIFDYEKLTELGDPSAVDWPTGKALDYNDMSLEEYLKANGANDDVILLDNAINGTEIAYDSALWWLMADEIDFKWNNTYAIEGGNDQLPAAFAKVLGDVVKLGSEVTAIDHTDKAVTVTYKSGGKSRTITADLCVCAIPFSTLRKVKITPALSAVKTAVIEGLTMMPVSRLWMQTKTRFWNAEGVGGLKVARTDTFIERLWDSTAVQDGTNGILLSYMMGANALAYAAQTDAMKPSYVTNEVAKFFPQINDELVGTVIKVWQEDPWVLGGWAYYKTGEMKDWFPAAKQPEGKIYFCGEHTSVWGGWMQGAFESANRVVKDIAG